MASGIEESQTLADLLAELGGVDPSRVRLHPSPGGATEDDVVQIEQEDGCLCELIDGVLVEKAMGAQESLLAGELLTEINLYLRSTRLGVALGADGMLRLRPRLVRIPDVSFISWDQLPEGEFPSKPVPDLYPDLAVEVLSDGNTTGEIERKLADYFAAGCRLVWIIDPRSRSADSYTSVSDCVPLEPNQSLDGGNVLPGFKLSLKDLFAVIKRRK